MDQSATGAYAPREAQYQPVLPANARQRTDNSRTDNNAPSPTIPSRLPCEAVCAHRKEGSNACLFLGYLRPHNEVRGLQYLSSRKDLGWTSIWPRKYRPESDFARLKSNFVTRHSPQHFYRMFIYKFIGTLRPNFRTFYVCSSINTPCNTPLS